MEDDKKSKTRDYVIYGGIFGAVFVAFVAIALVLDSNQRKATREEIRKSERECQKIKRFRTNE